MILVRCFTVAGPFDNGPFLTQQIRGGFFLFALRTNGAAQKNDNRSGCRAKAITALKVRLATSMRILLLSDLASFSTDFRTELFMGPSTAQAELSHLPLDPIQLRIFVIAISGIDDDGLRLFIRTRRRRNILRCNTRRGD
jgi:hypothetical protein